jgi:hypothetical protein
MLDEALSDLSAMDARQGRIVELRYPGDEEAETRDELRHQRQPKALLSRRSLSADGSSHGRRCSAER